jgi:(p)ppGpp synthase/HD superfamily hydrolase
VTAVPVLTDRFAEAAKWAAQIHNDHVRKGSNVPYVSHLFAVASLVLEDGGDEDQAIAALLHDAVEDDKATLDEVRARFGDEVAAIVDACSDTLVNPKPPWRERKQHYIAHLNDPHTTDAALRVSNADKVHNARCILADYRAVGDDLWHRFNQDARSAEAQLWYYEQLAKAFTQRRPGNPLATELASLVAQLRAEAT